MKEVKYPFENWWEKHGRKKCGVLDNHLARLLALDAWNASRTEMSRYTPPEKYVRKEEQKSDSV